MKVTIDVTVDHKGNPRGDGKAEATVIFIDRQGKRYERKATAEVENDTKNALTLQIVATAIKILVKPCEIEIHLDNKYIKYCVKNDWPNEWRKRGWKKANGKRPANVELWKRLYVLLSIHKVTFTKEEKE